VVELCRDPFLDRRPVPGPQLRGADDSALPSVIDAAPLQQQARSSSSGQGTTDEGLRRVASPPEVEAWTYVLPKVESQLVFDQFRVARQRLGDACFSEASSTVEAGG